MEEVTNKYKEWHKNTDHNWKVAVIDLCKKDNVMYIDTNLDIDWLYDDCIDYLTNKSTRRLTNLAKRLGYSKPPCHHCRMIIKHWKDNDDYKWSPEVAHLFN